MQVEILYFDGCPTYRVAEEALNEALQRCKVDAAVDMVAVNTDEEARRLRFPGSPTLRVDGSDLFPAGERDEWRLGCRIYPTPEGLRSSPTAEMIEEALIDRGNVHA